MAQDLFAYHIAKPGQDHPPILIATTRRDDRVHPGHARKMVAKLQGMGYEAYLYEPEAGFAWPIYKIGSYLDGPSLNSEETKGYPMGSGGLAHTTHACLAAPLLPC
jgi:hypothetical protein